MAAKAHVFLLTHQLYMRSTRSARRLVSDKGLSSEPPRQCGTAVHAAAACTRHHGARVQDGVGALPTHSPPARLHAHGADLRASSTCRTHNGSSRQQNPVAGLAPHTSQAAALHPAAARRLDRQAETAASRRRQQPNQGGGGQNASLATAAPEALTCTPCPTPPCCTIAHCPCARTPTCRALPANLSTAVLLHPAASTNR